MEQRVIEIADRLGAQEKVRVRSFVFQEADL